MKFKYFLRGLGTGIIFSAVICLVAFQNVKSSSISDKEIIERAKALGMTEKKESLEDVLLSEKNTNQKKNKKESDDTKSPGSVDDPKESDSTEDLKDSGNIKEQTTQEQTTQEKTTQEQTEEQKETEESTENVNQKQKTITITIKGGATSYPVCQKLQELGVIKDATDFDNYLIKNGYANRISVGTHSLTIGMTYEEIAVAISDPR